MRLGLQPKAPTPGGVAAPYFRGIARVNVMGKRKQFKRARNRDGVIFSQISKDRIKSISLIEKIFGREVFENPFHPAWLKLFSAEQELRKSEFGEYDKYIGMTEIGINYILGRKKYHSIYIESEAVFDFIANSEPRQSDGKVIMQAADEIYRQVGGEGLAIHFPNKKESVFLCLNKGVGAQDNEEKVMILYARGDDVGYNPFNKDGTWDFDGDQDFGQEENWRIIFNLFMYMDAFPECVSSGPPQIISGKVDGESQRRVVASSVISSVYEKAKSSPHMRRGHFRVLKSEKFTNKRFQSVYVRPAMVSGGASTVCEPE